MKYRRDIHLWLVKRMGNGSKWHKVYQHSNGLLYCASYDFNNKNKISYYSYFSVWGITAQLKEEIEDYFKVAFAQEDDRIVCRCGESTKFSAFYGKYSLILKCEECLNQFTAYSG